MLNTRVWNDWTGAPEQQQGDESKVDLATGANRTDGGESPDLVSENKIAIPARRYFMLVSYQKARQ